jgi:hypothetical protein
MKGFREEPNAPKGQEPFYSAQDYATVWVQLACAVRSQTKEQMDSVPPSLMASWVGEQADFLMVEWEARWGKS